MKNGFHYIIHVITIIGLAVLLSTNNSREKTIQRLSDDTGRKRIELEMYNLTAALDSMKEIVTTNRKTGGNIEVFTPKAYYVVTETDGDFEHDMNYIELLGTLKAKDYRPSVYYVIGELQLNDNSIHYSKVQIFKSFTKDDKFIMWDEQANTLCNSQNYINSNKCKVIHKRAHIFFNYADASKFRNSL